MFKIKPFITKKREITRFNLFKLTIRRTICLSFLVLLTTMSLLSNAMNNEQVPPMEEKQVENLALVKKQIHRIDSFDTFLGVTIKDVKVGWESYGNLNDTKSNAVLITHYFTGSSHAAGKYKHDDAEPGYWDSIIGPGKAIDTNKFFVISVDSLVNISAHDPNVHTTGPASINPDTGKPYGLSFPIVTMRDFVNVQKSVLDSLGIETLHAVLGPSMGSMQAIEWASAYPDKVKRLVSVIGSASSDPWTSAALEQWTIPIKLDRNWNEGNYYSGKPPIEGLTAALMFITQSALHPKFFAQIGEQLNYKPLEEAASKSILAKHSINQWLYDRAKERAELMDANHLLYLVKANQLFMTGHGDSLRQGLANIKAKTLFIPSADDLLLMPYHAKMAHDILRTVSPDNTHQYTELSAGLGHLDGVSAISQQAQLIKSFLESDASNTYSEKIDE